MSTCLKETLIPIAKSNVTLALISTVLLLLSAPSAVGDDDLVARYLVDRGNKKLKAGDADGALEDYTKAINSRPDYIEAYRSRSRLFQLQNQTDKAIEDHRRLLELTPRDAIALFSLAQCYQRLKEFDQALDAYARVVAVTNDFSRTGNKERLRANAYFCRAQIWDSKSKHAEAATDYTEALKLTPANPQLHLRRGQAYANSQQYAKALADFAEAHKRGTKSYSLLTNWAWMLATCPDDRCRDGKRALELIRQCSRTDNWTLDVTAAAYAELGRFDEAIGILTKVTEEFDKQKLGAHEKKVLARIELYKAGKGYRDAQYGKDD